MICSLDEEAQWQMDVKKRASALDHELISMLYRRTQRVFLCSDFDIFMPVMLLRESQHLSDFPIAQWTLVLA